MIAKESFVLTVIVKKSKVPRIFVRSVFYTEQTNTQEFKNEPVTFLEISLHVENSENKLFSNIFRI